METTRSVERSLEDRFARYAPAEHRTFYREGGVSVTDRWLTTASRRFAVGELRNLRTVREPATPLGAASTAMACILVVAAATFVAFSGEPALMLGGPVVAALPIGFALVSWRLRPRSFALYAEYGGRTVQVLEASDERRYNQICRALLRAREYSRDHAY
jgi:hypothetical protein